MALGEINTIEREVKAKPKSSLDFRLMSLIYKFRDLFLPRMSILKEVGIEAGFHVLDYGCGPGSYLIPLVELVGVSGQIYALDANPLAIQGVQRLVSRRRLGNMQTILSDLKTGLPSKSVDVVLLYDVLHDLKNAGKVLVELHRVLKPQGILSLSDHHMKAEEIISQVTSGRLFMLSASGKRTQSYLRGE